MDGARHKTAESEASVSQVFSPVELAVLHMARHDSVASLRVPSRLDRIVAFVFGLRPANRLTSNRLESLRHVAVLARHKGRAKAERELSRLFNAGYTGRQADALLGLARA